MTFRTGQKVIFIGFPSATWRQCLDQWLHPIPKPWPVLKSIYTVAKLHTYDNGLYLSLSELPEGTSRYWTDGWLSTGFRPVVERKTDISIFTRMLAPTKRKLALTADKQ